ncbi:hypothetical protein D3C71_1850540 [compost metagenome]
MVMDARQGKFYLYGYTDKKRCAALPGGLWRDIRRPVGTQNEFLAGGLLITSRRLLPQRRFYEVKESHFHEFDAKWQRPGDYTFDSRCGR